MAPMPGTITFSSCWFEWKIAPKKARNSSGRRKLKNAALGLRQNSRRSRRYWRQASVSTSAIQALLSARDRRAFYARTHRRLLGGRQLQIDVLQRGARHRQSLEALAS